MTHMQRGLAIVAGLARPHPGTRGIRRTLNAADAQGPWYPPTIPGEFTGEQAALDGAALARIEAHHQEDYLAARRRQPWVQARVLEQWRRQMNAWLDAEWLAWRDLLHTYPGPGGPA